MNETGSTSTRSLTTIRWTARIIAFLSIAVFLVFLAADCVKKGTIAIENDRIVMTVFMFLAFIGLIIALRSEGIGAAWTVASLIGVNISAPTTLAEAGVLTITVMYGLPALLFLYCWWQTKKQIHPKAT